MKEIAKGVWFVIWRCTAIGGCVLLTKLHIKDIIDAMENGID